MNKTQAIRTVIEATSDEPVIFTTGYSSRIARHVADRPNHFYMTGSMGLAASIGTGIALSSGRRTVVVDGDGALAMNPGCLLTAGTFADLPLFHLVLDDGLYESTGGQSVPSRRVSFSALAEASGYADVWQVDDLTKFQELLRSKLITCRTPTFVHCSLTEREGSGPPPRVEGELAWYQSRFAAHLATQR
ncbi:thiamine pyrophosphate-dependent enzyme [Actinoplanes siamensis]|uniref:Sulfopyruvate decarboxylase subunit beta n=1 Tax=Actinoplanes siamensis TaxID=1223317 RepID=A0A919N322_9ACTN|nr:thiamine pyrophosphate-dependent enzyme [Actinoplanes siamensis]GIF03118.1 sulfopyruvate decarboxylase subunit beta [Actinoplanes siamensis]